jgi:hypothetical protein
MELNLNICKNCYPQDFDLNARVIGTCQLCHQDKLIQVGHIWEDFIDRIFYQDTGGEGGF